MTLKVVHSFLVHPAKHLDDPPSIGGTRVTRNNSERLFQMLDEVYTKADTECDIDISFDQRDDGEQQNDCRDLLIGYLRSRRMDAARRIAERLQSVTTNRSGLGLLFLMAGDEGTRSKLVVSRFPADSGILAEQTEDALTVAFLERIFMKSATSYKSAVYSGASYAADFWVGTVVDRQINSGRADISNYWIKEFLLSDFRTTSAAGTRRFAEALRRASDAAPDVAIKIELTAAAILVRGLAGKSVSAADIVQRLALSERARQLVLDHVSPARLREERFRFSAEEFERHVPFRSVELDSGATLTAKTDSFDQVFVRQQVAEGDGRVRFTTEGTVVNDRLRKGR